jgi:hypothetical protein
MFKEILKLLCNGKPKQDLDPHRFGSLDPDPHCGKNLDPDP